MAGGLASRLRSFDWFRKVPKDLSEATLPGSIISLVAMFLMVVLFFLELRAFLTTVTKTQVMIDRSDTLRINFNFTFPHLACQYASVDVSDVLGSARFNLTKTVRKRPVNAEGSVVGDAYAERPGALQHEPEDSPKLALPAAEGEDAASSAPTGAVELTASELVDAEKRHPLLLVNFYAPWCPWSQRMAPVWDAAARAVHTKFPPVRDGRVLLGRVDCTVHVDACRAVQIQGFPSVRVFRSGSDLVANPAALGRGALSEHATYVGDRTVEAITAFVDTLVPPDGYSSRSSGAGFALAAAAGVLERGAHPGCAIDGFVTVKKVPGALVVSAQSPAHSFVPSAMNASHIVHALTVGPAPPPRKLAELARLMPGGLPPNWADKLAGQAFGSPAENTTHEHYLQVVRTVVTPLGSKASSAIDAYEYTAHSHAFEAEGGALPRAKFSFAPSPMLVHISEESRYGAYHFLTTVSALIGGVFTVASIADAGAHTVRRMVKKDGMGKLY